jgi:type II secretory pathway component PulK
MKREGFFILRDLGARAILTKGDRNAGRKGFSLITAIMVMVIMAGIGVAILSISSTAIEQKTHAFMRAQAELYAGAGMEYAVNEFLRRGATIGTNKKPEEVNITIDNFSVQAKITYTDGNDHTRFDENSAYMLIDTFVTTNIDGMPIRVARRTAQLP